MMLRWIVLVVVMSLPLSLEAIEGTITLSEVSIQSKSISVKFKGKLEGFDQVYIFELLRPYTLSDSEWTGLQDKLNANRDKTVKIAIPSKRYGSRGPVLTIFDTQTISMVEAK